MPLTRNRFNLYLSLACLAGYFWLALISRLPPEEIGKQYDVCLIHHFLGMPCPSCGSTRSVISLLHGDLPGALYWNPFGFLIFSILIISPIWIAYDLFLKKDSFFRFYRLTERTLSRKWVAIPAIILVLINWIWNFYKNV
jgi:hypothetical protein